MEKIVCFLMCLAAFISAGSALKCYSCDSDKLDGCIKSNNHKDVMCGAPAPNFQSVCAYKVMHDTAKNTDKVVASCEQIAVGAALNKDSLMECKAPPTGTEVKECRLCNSDLCNSSVAFRASMISFLCLPLMYLITKLVLS